MKNINYTNVLGQAHYDKVSFTNGCHILRMTSI